MILDQMEIESPTAAMEMIGEAVIRITVSVLDIVTATPLISVTMAEEKGMDAGTLVLEILDGMVETGIQMIITEGVMEERHQLVGIDTKVMVKMTCAHRTAETSIRKGTVPPRNKPTERSDLWSSLRTGATILSPLFPSDDLLKEKSFYW